MSAQHMTQSYINALRWEGQDKRMGLGDGLYLNLRRASITYLYRRRSNGTETFETLGRHPALSLKDAKAEAADRNRRIDLSNATLGDLLAEYRPFVEKRQRRPKHTLGYLDRVFKGIWLKRRAREVRRGELVKLLKDYRTMVANKPRGRKGDGTRAADQLRSVLYKFFNYCLQHDAVDVNPLAGVTADVTEYIYKPRTRVLSDEEIRAIWALDHPHGQILKFMLLTGLRISETRLGYRLGDRWFVPMAVSKTGGKVQRDHWVHLTPTAAALLPLPARSNAATQHWVKTWCEREGIPPFTPHDVRRSTVTRLHDLGLEPWIVERWVGHNLQGMMAVYNHAEYIDERVAVSKTLESHLLGVVDAPRAQILVHPGARSGAG